MKPRDGAAKRLRHAYQIALLEQFDAPRIVKAWFIVVPDERN